MPILFQFIEFFHISHQQLRNRTTDETGLIQWATHKQHSVTAGVIMSRESWLILHVLTNDSYSSLKQLRLYRSEVASRPLIKLWKTWRRSHNSTVSSWLTCVWHVVQRDNKTMRVTSWRYHFHVARLRPFQVTAAWCKWSLNTKHSTFVIVDRRRTQGCQWSQSRFALMPLTQVLDEKYTTGQNVSNEFNLRVVIYFFFFTLYPFNSLFSPQMKEVKPLACLPAPLSAAFNVSGKFQRTKQR